jgi:class 3 adenylate cyclase
MRYEVRYRLPAPPERVWPVMANTDLLNRRIGLPPTERSPSEGEAVGRADVRCRVGPLTLRWREEPFDFREPDYYWERRVMAGGPLREFNGGLRFAPDGEGGTEVTVESEFVPAGPVGALLVRALWSKSKREFDRLIARLQDHFEGRESAPFGPGVDLAPPEAAESARRRLAAAPAEFRGEPLAARLIEHLCTAGDAELLRIRPFVLADRWGVERRDVLRVCLRGAAAGVLDLSWDLLCPNCLGAKARWSTLEDLRGRAHCPDCRIGYDAQFDRSVEATFRPTARYRPLDAREFCAGGPRNTPQIVAQHVLAPGEEKNWTQNLGAGRYRLRDLSGRRSQDLFLETGAVDAPVTVSFHTDSLELDAEPPVREPGGVRLEVRNASEKELQLILERCWDYGQVATAAQVGVFQEFRTLFGSEVLAPDLRLGIRTLPLMFTDLKGSTALYGRLGDAAAYALVRDHFTLLQNVTGAHGGGVIKTIGDAVMAGFPSAREAVACVLQIRRDLAAFNFGRDEPLRLKIGLHQGPCIAARSHDDRLDYFGGTVNLAARTHEQSSGDDIVVTRAILDDRDARALLAGIPVEPFEADLRGLGRQTLYRVWP